MRKTLLITAFALTFLGVTAATTQNAYAFGGRGHGMGPSDEHREEMLERKANFIGVTVEELKEAWENRTVHELLEERNITPESLWEHMKELVREHMSERGLTDEQINERFERKEEHRARMQEWRENNPDAEPPFKGRWHRK